MEMKPIDKVSYTLLVIGGLSWGLIGFFKYDLVSKIFGVGSGLSRAVFAVVGLAAVYGLYSMVTMMAKMQKK